MSSPIHSRVGEVTERIERRSRDQHSAYRERISRAHDAGARRAGLSYRNLAHGFAAWRAAAKAMLADDIVPNLTAFRAFAQPAELGAGIISFGEAA